MSAAARGGRAGRGWRSSAVLGLAHLLAGLAIVAGWRNREERYLLPDQGLGYLLGIIGLLMMLLLLLYSARKRISFMRYWGRISIWFQVHMILGLAGPVAILFHANFRLGSSNSNIALGCALLVSASGVVGRLIHGRLHHYLSGRRQTLADVREELESRRQEALRDYASEKLANCVRGLEERILAPDRGLLGELRSYARLGRHCRRTTAEARRCLRLAAREAGVGRAKIRRAERAVKAHVRAVRRVAAFTLYERIFGLWHAAHLPLTFLLFAAAAVHVTAVHMY